MSTQAAQADETRNNPARAHAAQHRIGEAEAVYREILAGAPDTPEALNFVAMCELSRGEFASAQRDLERAAHLEPTQPEIWKNVGIVH
ncbi:MAG: tetratricopeptide repeat protein, partial [Rhodanobacteraceae bacterium]